MVLKYLENKNMLMLTEAARIGRWAAAALYPIMPSRHVTNWCHSICPVVPPGWLR